MSAIASSITTIQTEYTGKTNGAIANLIIKTVVGNNIFPKIFLIFHRINIGIDLSIKPFVCRVFEQRLGGEKETARPLSGYIQLVR